jgi:polyhydroxybutyrate depolymerase
MSTSFATRFARFAVLLAITLAAIVLGREKLVRADDATATIEVDGRTRTYFAHVPSNYDGKHALPLVIVLHGATQSAESAERMSGMSRLADREGFIAAYPTGVGRIPTWNAGNCCGYAMTNHVDDIGFLRVMIAKLESAYTIDRRRIYVTGISNGAMLSFRAACEMSDVVAAVAPVEGAQDVECTPKSPVSVLIFHGTADRLVPIDGGSTPFQVGPKRNDTAAADTIEFWVKRDGCSSEPKHEETAEVHIDSYSGCTQNTAVAFYAIQGGRHMWPGLRISGNHVDATEIMWRFFAAHPKAQ